MTHFERMRLFLHPLLPALPREVKRRLLDTMADLSEAPLILDVGGRKSPYTVGVPARIVIGELRRETTHQDKLDLGLSTHAARDLHGKRSNVLLVFFNDMVHAATKKSVFDVVVAVEVLEHVEDDAGFVREISRVLKPGGVFLMTTPNGDYNRKLGKDHHRHYRRDELRALLLTHFGNVSVDYAIRDGVFHRWGLRSWSVKRPFQTLLSMCGNFVSWWQSARTSVREQAVGTDHLVATARKSL